MQKTSASILIAGACFALLAPLSSAQAQATRTWVSGVGDDVNPCSRTAPCKTFAGAISKTASGGEINCIDPGGFGAVTITKSITLDCGGTFGSILNAGTTGINLSSTAGIRVIIRNLSINGATTGINGISVNIGSSLLVENVQIFGQTNNGINTSALAATANIQVKNSSFEYITGTGVQVTTSAGFAIGQVSNSSFFTTGSGVTAGTNGFVTVANSTFLQNTTGAQAAGNGTLSVDSSTFNSNTNAITAGAGTNVRAASNALYDNSSGLTATGTMITDGKNRVVGATASPPATIPLK